MAASNRPDIEISCWFEELKGAFDKVQTRVETDARCETVKIVGRAIDAAAINNFTGSPHVEWNGRSRRIRQRDNRSVPYIRLGPVPSGPQQLGEPPRWQIAQLLVRATCQWAEFQVTVRPRFRRDPGERIPHGPDGQN